MNVFSPKIIEKIYKEFSLIYLKHKISTSIDIIVFKKRKKSNV